MLLDDILRRVGAPGAPAPTFPGGGIGVAGMQQPAPPRSIWEAIRDRIEGARKRAAESLMPSPGELLSPEQVGQARRRGLLAGGAALLENSGAVPGSPFTPTLAQALGRGITAAQGGYQEGVGGALQIAEKQRLDAFRADLARRYPITPDMPPDQINRALQGMFAEAATRDPELAQTLQGVAAALANASGSTPESLMQVDDIVGPGGDPVKIIMGEKSGKYVHILPKAIDPQVAARDAHNREKDALTFETDLAKEFLGKTEKLEEAAADTDKALANVTDALAGNGAAQMSLLFAFIKNLDESVVRESEVDMISGAAGTWIKLRNFVDRYRKGDRSFIVPSELTRQLEKILTVSRQRAQQLYDNKRDYYMRRGAMQQIKPARLDVLLKPMFQSPPADTIPYTGTAEEGRYMPPGKAPPFRR